MEDFFLFLLLGLSAIWMLIGGFIFFARNVNGRNSDGGA